MRVFRIRVTFERERPVCFTGLFADGFEARDQVHADYPQARSVSAIHIPVGGAA